MISGITTADSAAMGAYCRPRCAQCGNCQLLLEMKKKRVKHDHLIKFWNNLKQNPSFRSVEQLFTFLDWRQDFGGSLSIGDVYYDLAKLLHGLIMSHELIVREHFWVEWKEQKIRFDFHRKQVLVDCEQHFGQWLESEGYDRKKVYVLTALVYLNIAALHHSPYSLLLFALGKFMLSKEIGGYVHN